MRFSLLPLILLAGCAGSNLREMALPARVAGPPGTILSRAKMPGVPKGATAERILYVTHDTHGKTVASSGVLIVPSGPVPAGGRDVVVWAHGTTGVAEDCAPSLKPKFFWRLPGLAEFLARGYAVVTTDYPGLGTPGPTPYLVGQGEGKAVLDAVRAAGRLTPTTGRFAVFGHSQGGHSVLFAGQMAKAYAPELKLVGLAAVAPATDLAALLDDDISTPLGKVLACYTLWSWSRVYGADMHTVVNPQYDSVMQRIVSTCCTSAADAFRLVGNAKKLKEGFVVHDPATTEPWKSLMRLNRPGQERAGAPLFIAQGTKDEIVRPQVTEQFAKQAKARGEKVDFVWLQGVTHVPAAQAAAPYAAEWIAGKFESRTEQTNRPLTGYPGQRLDLMNSPRTVWAASRIGPQQYFAQPNDWTCSASSYIMVYRALTGKDLPLSEVVARTGAVEGVGAENSRVVEALKMLGPQFEVISGQSSANPKGAKVPAHVRAAEKAREHATLTRLLRQGYLVILNFREPEDHGGHYGVLQGLNDKAIQIADPYYGRTSVMPWEDFDFRTGYSDPVLHGWYVAVRPKP